MPAHSIRALLEAIERGDLTTVTAIVDATPALLEACGEHNALCRDKTPLMYALQCQRTSIARLLLRRGANAAARMAGGPRSSVIALAVGFATLGKTMADMVAIVGELVDAGADATEGLWPACHAYRRATDRIEMIELLLERGADADRPVGTSGDSTRRLVEINARLFSPRVLALFNLTPRD